MSAETVCETEQVVVPSLLREQVNYPQRREGGRASPLQALPPEAPSSSQAKPASP